MRSIPSSVSGQGNPPNIAEVNSGRLVDVYLFNNPMEGKDDKKFCALSLWKKCSLTYEVQFYFYAFLFKNTVKYWLSTDPTRKGLFLHLKTAATAFEL